MFSRNTLCFLHQNTWYSILLVLYKICFGWEICTLTQNVKLTHGNANIIDITETIKIHTVLWPNFQTHLNVSILILGACLEDKVFPKTNSLHEGRAQPLADIEEFALKIKVRLYLFT